MTVVEMNDQRNLSIVLEHISVIGQPDIRDDKDDMSSYFWMDGVCYIYYNDRDGAKKARDKIIKLLKQTGGKE